MNKLRMLSAVFAGLVLTAIGSGAVWADAPGKNGARTIGAANTVINQYTTLAAGAAAGAGTITVLNVAALTSGEAVGGGVLAPGDVVMLYQARGATIDTTNTPSYGNINNLGNAGNYELRTVRAVNGNNIGLDGASNGASCTNGLKNSYSAGAQVIRVPQYSSLTVSGGASVVATPWDGSIGGVVSALVQSSLNVNGSVTVDGQGFRGGIRDGGDRASGGAQTVTFVSDAAPAGGAKGEGIASEPGGSFGGVALAYSNPGGNFDIGAPANGGGGGGSHNGGGGGGANAAVAVTPYCTAGTSTYTTAANTAFVWCGQGVMNNTVPGNTAWQFDPGFKANGGLTNIGGGGRGGYTFSNVNLNALVAAGAPAETAWGGDNRRALGGWGGRPLPQALGQRLFFGGGGGAGANNNDKGGAGGAGGGVILIEAGALSGTGFMTASGVNGQLATDGANFGNDAPGGGGAGGTIVVQAASGSVGGYRVNGGLGGDQNINNNEAEGPGGGGGGGIIAATGGSQLSNGGTGGNTNSTALTEFPRNGATDGGAGLTGQTAPPIRTTAASCTSLSVAKTNNVATLTSGGTTTYTLTVVNSGPSAADGLRITDPVATGLSCSAVSCTSTAGGAVCPSAGSTTMAYLQGAGVILPTLPGNSTATFTLNCGVTATGQ